MAAADIFLTIKGPDIQGESLDKVHKDMIEIQSFSWGQANLGTALTGGGAGAGAVASRTWSLRSTSTRPRRAVAWLRDRRALHLRDADHPQGRR